MIGKKTLLRCFVGTLTCVAVVAAGWDAEAASRRHCRRACCCPTTCCAPVCDPCCTTACAPACDPCCQTACTTCYRSVDACCCYRSCGWTVVSSPVIVSSPCCVADTKAASSTEPVASKPAAKPVPVSATSAAR